MQIHGELSKAQRLSIIDAASQVLRNEGVRGFYKGIMPLWLVLHDMTGLTASLLREGSYSTIRMGGYENIKSLLVNSSAERDNLPLSKKIIAGAVSGALGAGIANPTDLVIHSFL